MKLLTLLCGIGELKQWWPPPQAHVTAPNKGAVPACRGVDRFPWLPAWETLAGKAGEQSVLCGLTEGEKGEETGANKLGPAW